MTTEALKISEIIPKTTTKTSCGISRKVSRAAITKGSNGEMSISVYSGKIAERHEVAIGIKKLKVAFPKMENEFFNLLTERLIDNGFTSERLKAAVNYVLDNFQYKELNISDIIRFDKKVKLYTYAETCNMVAKGYAAFSDFEIREVDGNVYRVKKTDLI